MLLEVILPHPPSAAADTVADLGEFALIDAVTAQGRQPETTVLGPGDDAAVVSAGDGRVVATTDVLVQGVHFRLDWSSAEQIGRKAVAANMADVAAMGANPSALLVGLACPGSTKASLVQDLARGMHEEAAKVGAGLVGGDIVSADQVVVSITALGDLKGQRPITRDGAHEGDVVAVAGRLGWSAAGMAVLGRGFRSPAAVVDAHRCPEPPYEQGPVAAAAGATSMIDISDGLLADLGHVASASGVGIDLAPDALVPEVKLVEVSSALGADPLAWVLTGGEDHSLVATFPQAGFVPEGWRQIGSVVPASADGPAVTLGGKPCEAGTDGGWQHWRK